MVKHTTRDAVTAHLNKKRKKEKNVSFLPRVCSWVFDMVHYNLNYREESGGFKTECLIFVEPLLGWKKSLQFHLDFKLTIVCKLETKSQLC